MSPNLVRNLNMYLIKTKLSTASVQRISKTTAPIHKNEEMQSQQSSDQRLTDNQPTSPT